MWIKTKWLPVFNQNYQFKGISLVSLITFVTPKPLIE